MLLQNALHTCQHEHWGIQQTLSHEQAANSNSGPTGHTWSTYNTLLSHESFVTKPHHAFLIKSQDCLVSARAHARSLGHLKKKRAKQAARLAQLVPSRYQSSPVLPLLLLPWHVPPRCPWSPPPRRTATCCSSVRTAPGGGAPPARPPSRSSTHHIHAVMITQLTNPGNNPLILPSRLSSHHAHATCMMHPSYTPGHAVLMPSRISDLIKGAPWW